MNKSFFKGNMTRDPELRRIASGDAVVSFGLAINKKWKTQSGEVKENVIYPNFDVWGTSGENFAKYVKKGDPVLVEAEYTQNTTEKDGEKKTFHGFKVLSWEFAGGSKNGNSNKVEEKDEEVFSGNPEDSSTKRKGRGPAKPKVTQPVEVDEDDSDIPF